MTNDMFSIKICRNENFLIIAFVKYILYQVDHTMNGINLNEFLDHNTSLGVLYLEHQLFLDFFGFNGITH